MSFLWTNICASRHPPRRLEGLDAQRLGGSAVTLLEQQKTCFGIFFVPQDRFKSGQEVSRAPQQRPRGSQDQPRPPQERPGEPQRQPRGLQDHPKSGQEGSKISQQCLKKSQEGSKTTPRVVKRAPRSAKSASREANNDFIDFTMVLHWSGGPPSAAKRASRAPQERPRGFQD